MSGLDPLVSTAENYRRFAEREAAGRSPAYEALALAVAGDDVVVNFLASLPADKRQPNLLFAAARLILDSVPDARSLHHLVDQGSDQLRAVMRHRRTQTNEVARCAMLLPALCRLPQPLALIEVGASAGLTLLPDRYSYDYDGHRVTGSEPHAPRLNCRVQGPVPLPVSVPSIVWRRGLDLNPLDPCNDADVHWLQCLIWPGQEGRAERLRDAVTAARHDPPMVTRGDLVDDLPELVDAVPSEAATVVVFHSAVLAYVDLDKRAAFTRAVEELGVHWISNEAPSVLPVTSTDDKEGFRLVEHGRDVLARTDPHGTWIHWTGH